MKKAAFMAAFLGICIMLAGCTAQEESTVIVCGGRPPSSAQQSASSQNEPRFTQAMEVEELEAPSNSLRLSVQTGPVFPAPEEIVISIDNGTDEEQMYGESYWLERLTDGVWEQLDYLPDTAWHDIGIVLAPHSLGEHRIHPVRYYGKEALFPGHYRYGNTFNGETYYAEFDIVSPEEIAPCESDVPDDFGPGDEALKNSQNAMGNLQKHGPDDPVSRPKPSKYSSYGSSQAPA